VHLDRQLLDQVVVFVIADVQVLSVFSQHANCSSFVFAVSSEGKGAAS
jgi:hypothetical protein